MTHSHSYRLADDTDTGLSGTCDTELSMAGQVCVHFCTDIHAPTNTSQHSTPVETSLPPLAFGPNVLCIKLLSIQPVTPLQRDADPLPAAQ